MLVTRHPLLSLRLLSDFVCGVFAKRWRNDHVSVSDLSYGLLVEVKHYCLLNLVTRVNGSTSGTNWRSALHDDLLGDRASRH